LSEVTTQVEPLKVVDREQQTYVIVILDSFEYLCSKNFCFSIKNKVRVKSARPSHNFKNLMTKDVTTVKAKAEEKN
jgi:hypothetical protein